MSINILITVKQTIKMAVLRQDYLTSSSFTLMDPFFTEMVDGGASWQFPGANASSAVEFQQKSINVFIDN